MYIEYHNCNHLQKFLVCCVDIVDVSQPSFQIDEYHKGFVIIAHLVHSHPPKSAAPSLTTLLLCSLRAVYQKLINYKLKNCN